MPDPTPGEKAYEAYAAILAPLAPWGTPDFAALPALHQRAWDAVAEAVLARTDHATSLLYVVVASAEPGPAQIQIQLCGAYRTRAEADQHVRHAAPVQPSLSFTIRLCPFPEHEEAPPC